MIQSRLYSIFLLVILLLVHPVIKADDWSNLNNDLEKVFLEYVDKANIDEPTKKKHAELIEHLCKIHEQGAKSNKVFEIMRYYNQFNPEPDVKLDLVLAQLWFDSLRGWYIASNTLISNLWLYDGEWSKEHKKTEEYFVDELSDYDYTIPYCDSLKKSGKKYFNILNFRLLDKHDPITKYVSWLKKAEATHKKALESDDASLAVKEYENVL